MCIPNLGRADIWMFKRLSNNNNNKSLCYSRHNRLLLPKLMRHKISWRGLFPSLSQAAKLLFQKKTANSYSKIDKFISWVAPIFRNLSDISSKPVAFLSSVIMGTPQMSYWGRDKMTAISHTTFSRGFYWMKMHELRLTFHEICSNSQYSSIGSDNGLAWVM